MKLLLFSYSVVPNSFVTPWTVAHQAPPWDFPGKNTGVGCHFLHHGIIPIQWLNLHLLHCRQILCHRAIWEAPVKLAKDRYCIMYIQLYLSLDAFELWCWRRLLRVPWTARRSNQSIVIKISPEYSLEGLILKLQYFGHFM